MKLLPCPLCGSATIKFVSNRPYWYLRCDNCGCTGGLCMTKDHAHETWNTRTPAIDVAAIREVMSRIRLKATPDDHFLHAWANTLERAIGD